MFNMCKYTSPHKGDSFNSGNCYIVAEKSYIIHALYNLWRLVFRSFNNK